MNREPSLGMVDQGPTKICSSIKAATTLTKKKKNVKINFFSILHITQRLATIHRAIQEKKSESQFKQLTLVVY